MAITLSPISTPLSRQSGIYTITNEVKSRIYVGSAVNLARRFIEHRKRLKENRHANRFLQSDFNLPGTELEFSILEIVSDITQLVQAEQKWIDQFYDNQDRCYNICPTAGNHLGMKHTEETKKKMSTASLGKKKSPEHVAAIRKEKQESKGKKVYQYSLDGMLIAEFPAIKAATRETKIASCSIASFLKRKCSMAGGFLWSDQNNNGETLAAYYLEFRELERKRKSTQSTQNNPNKRKKIANGNNT
jgi:hypothetical protein